MLKYILGLLLIASLFTACEKINVYEKSMFFSSHEWSSSVKPSFTFDVEDSSAYYNILFVLRHEDAYNYNNIWVTVDVKGPKDSFSIRKEFMLANNATGWLGSGMDDIFEHRLPFNDAPAPLHQGKYTFTLRQDMREDPLRHVLNAGIRVEKAN